MKRRILSILLLLSMLLTLLPAGVLAAGKTYGQIPIYLGYADVDYMAEEILKEIPTAGKSDREKIRAVYDWIIQHCSRYEWNGEYHFDEAAVVAQAEGAFYEKIVSAVEAGEVVLRDEYVEETFDDGSGVLYMSYDSNYYIASFAYEMMMTRTGNCAHFSALLSVLLNHLGYDCRLIDGDFINNSGTTVEHKWNYVLVGGKYYWLDVRMDHSLYSSSGTIGYYYFMQPNTNTWAAQHSWDHEYSDWLAQNAAAVADSYVAQAAVAAEGPWSRCSDWAKDVVEEAASAGLIPDSLYGMDLTNGITREEFAAVAVNLHAALGGAAEAYEGENPFSDTDDVYVLTAYGLGVVNGVGGGRFAPDKTLTREQAVTMLGRVYELAEKGAVADGSGLLKKGSDGMAFDDAGMIAEYAANYIAFFVDQGIVEGVGNHQFAPQKTMTREQAIKVAMETVKKLS